MAYVKTTWENEPSESTPINASNLNKIEQGIYDNSLGVETIGDITDLDTTEKSTLVGAINELKNAEIYSTNEVKTNKVWIDGKPIYRKVLVFQNISAKATSYHHNISDFGDLVYAYGNWHDSTNGFQPIGTVVPDNISNYGIGIGNFNESTFYIIIGSSRPSTNTIKIVVEYTKKTD